MSVDLEQRRAQLVAMRARVFGAAHDIAEGDDSLEVNAEQIVQEIDLAVARIDAGTYGTCARCGKEIPEERLEAVPYATLCVECRHIE